MDSNATHRIASMASTLVLAGCASFSVLSPASHSTVISPVATDVFWNADLQAGSLKIIVDPGPGGNDVTNQFSVASLSSDSHATASLNLPPGPHTLQVTGNLWNSSSKTYDALGASSTFQVSNSAGRAVTYTETILNYTSGWPQGQLGNVSFGGSGPNAVNPNVNLIFTFDGNTNDVVPYFAPRPCRPSCPNDGINDGQGFEIVAGTATVTVQDAKTGAPIAQATFMPVAGVFVSVDNGNGGIGFGSKGALPSDPSFPSNGVEVDYPYALIVRPTATTDLTSNFSATADWALSCPGFNGSPGQQGPGTCEVPIWLATTAGLLSITANDQQATAPAGTNAGIFTTVIH